MDLESVYVSAREKMKGYCRVCPICDGRACVGEVPGMGGIGTGGSFKENVAALARVRLQLRTIHEVREPELGITLFGRQLSLPVLGAPITGSSYNMGGQMPEEDFVQAMVAGCLQAGTLCMTGDGADPAMYESGIQAGCACGGESISIIKPRAQEEVKELITRAEECGLLATGMDIDGAGLITMALKGQPVGPKSQRELRELIESSSLPFIVKGVMTPDEAELVVDAGAAGVVVSNHGGRVLDGTPGTADVLESVAARIRGRAAILVDGGVRSGADVLKLLALGADAALIGRPLIIAAYGGGDEGVVFYLDKIRNELLQAMLLTGVADVGNVVPETIVRL